MKNYKIQGIELSPSEMSQIARHFEFECYKESFMDNYGLSEDEALEYAFETIRVRDHSGEISEYDAEQYTVSEDTKGYIKDHKREVNALRKENISYEIDYCNDLYRVYNNKEYLCKIHGIQISLLPANELEYIINKMKKIDYEFIEEE